MISNCGHDENGKYSGGKAGDQTGGEYAVIAWYNRPWNVVLRHPNAAVGIDLATVAAAAAQNPLVGYDQGQRGTYYSHLKASNYNPAQITIACEGDCSSTTASNVKAVGYRKGIAALQNVNSGCTTRNLRAALKAAGFKELTESKYLTSDKYLMKGDVLLYEGHHTAINISNGSAAGGTTTNADGKIKKLAAASKFSKSLAGSYKTTAELNLRYGAGSDKYAVAALMPKGTTFKCYGYYSENNGTKWYFGITVVNGKQYTGFASSKYLKK